MKTQSMKWITRIATLAALAVNATWVTAATQTNFNFDTDTVGSPPAGWLAIAQGTAGSTVDVTSAQSTTFPNSLEMRTQGDFTTGPDLARVLGLGAFTSNIMGYFTTNQISFSIRLTANASQQFRFSLVDQGGNNAGGNMQVLFRNGGVFAQYGTSSLLETNVLSVFNVDTWYDVLILNRPVDSKYDVSVYNHGGGLLGKVDNLPITEAVPDGLIFVNDGWINIGQTGQQSVFIDSVQIAQVPEPAATALLALGSLAFFTARRGRK